MHSFFAGIKRRNRRLQSTIYLNRQSAGMEFGIVNLGIVVAIIFILLGLAIKSYYPLIIRSMYPDLASYIFPIRQEMITSYLIKGKWPQSIDPKLYIHDSRLITIDNIITDNGNQDYIFHYNHNPETKYTLSLRRVPEDQTATFVWLCGYGNHVGGMTASAKNNTNAPEEFLPITCQ